LDVKKCKKSWKRLAGGEVEGVKSENKARGHSTLLKKHKRRSVCISFVQAGYNLWICFLVFLLNRLDEKKHPNAIFQNHCEYLRHQPIRLRIVVWIFVGTVCNSFFNCFCHIVNSPFCLIFVQYQTLHRARQSFRPLHSTTWPDRLSVSIAGRKKSINYRNRHWPLANVQG
jgi:hypothetical protein